MKALSWLAPTKTSALDGSDVTELILYRLIVLHDISFLKETVFLQPNDL